jgi:hypothetical protein
MSMLLTKSLETCRAVIGKPSLQEVCQPYDQKCANCITTLADGLPPNCASRKVVHKKSFWFFTHGIHVVVDDPPPKSGETRRQSDHRRQQLSFGPHDGLSVQDAEALSEVPRASGSLLSP